MLRNLALPSFSQSIRSQVRLTAVGALAYVVNATFALVVLLLLSPLWVVLAIAIKLESPGPVLYPAQRIGRGGAPFAMFKFRKMHDGARGALLTTTDDDRFTRIGAFLARTKLDELPQLLNVLRGEMRFVGPRPEAPEFVERHAAMFAPVLSLSPGITGLCQVVYRNESSLFSGDDFEAWYESTLLPHKIMVDRAYLEHRGPLLDLRIVFWTLVALVAPVSVGVDRAAGSITFRAGGTTPVPEVAPDTAMLDLDDWPVLAEDIHHREPTLSQ